MPLPVHIGNVAITRRGALAAGVAVLASAAAASGCSPALESQQPNPLSTGHDLVVVGGGAAGMAAALAAVQAGVDDVLLVEKQQTTGGNSCFATSGMNAACSHFQQQAGIQDTPQQFASDTLQGGHGVADAQLVEFMCAASADAILWLATKGIVLDDVVQAPGASAARCHRPYDGSAVGASLVPGLEAQLANSPVSLACNVQATRVVKDAAGRVVAVECQGQDGSTARVPAKAVVLASGGMCSDAQAVREVRPDLASYASTNTPASTGDGYRMAREAGAQLVGMEYLQVHATVSADIPSVAVAHVPIAEALRRSGAVLVNAQGARFCDETATREVVAAALAAQQDAHAWLVFDDVVSQANAAVDGSYRVAQLVLDAPDAASLAEATGIDAQALAQTLDACTAAARGEAADIFGRSVPPASFEGPLHAIEVAPGVHCQLGGVRIDTACRVLDEQGQPIDGLYAAGEVSGGVHGANRISGNGVCDSVVMGRNAGQEAAAFAKGDV